MVGTNVLCTSYEVVTCKVARAQPFGGHVGTHLATSEQVLALVGGHGMRSEHVWQVGAD